MTMLNNDSISLIPVDWPEWWRGSHQYFLEGMPYFGTQCRVIKHVCRILEVRSAESFNAKWSAAGYSVEKCLEISKNLRAIMSQYEVHWPNCYFFPDDRVCLMLGLIPGVPFDTEDPVEDARICFQLKDDCVEYYDIVCEGKYKDFIALIISGRFKSEKPVKLRKCLPDHLKSFIDYIKRHQKKEQSGSEQSGSNPKIANKE